MGCIKRDTGSFDYSSYGQLVSRAEKLPGPIGRQACEIDDSSSGPTRYCLNRAK